MFASPELKFLFAANVQFSTTTRMRIISRNDGKALTLLKSDKLAFNSIRLNFIYFICSRNKKAKISPKSMLEMLNDFTRCFHETFSTEKMLHFAKKKSLDTFSIDDAFQNFSHFICLVN